VLIESGRLERCITVLRLPHVTSCYRMLPYYMFYLNQLSVPCIAHSSELNNK